MDVKFVGKVKVTKQGQVTLPLEARNDLDISVDSEVFWYEVDGHLVVLKELLGTKELEAKYRKKR